MTKNIEIDLESIPHPKDCHPVPDGAIILAGTPFWLITGEDRLTWAADGYSEDHKMQKFSSLRLTAEPIIPHPTPEDSPIIINRYGDDKCGEEPISNAVALWVDDVDLWVTTDGRGCDWWLGSSQITDWSPAIVTKSGHGIWDERDKRDRTDADGELVVWSASAEVWFLNSHHRERYGSLAAVRRRWGDDFLVGFTDEQGSEK